MVGEARENAGWWAAMHAVLANLGAYYGQFVSDVAAALDSGLGPLKKQLQVRSGSRG